jgi:hypothetical protein
MINQCKFSKRVIPPVTFSNGIRKVAIMHVYHDLKACKGRGLVSYILDFGTGWNGMFIRMLRSLYPWKNTHTYYLLDMSMGGTRSGFGGDSKEVFQYGNSTPVL